MTPERRRQLIDDSRTALERWLEDQWVLTRDGKPVTWGDGRPVAIDIAAALESLESLAWLNENTP